MEQTARHVVFSGRVQGVGFRYTARQVADRYDLTGWVKNLPNGNVEALFQGPEPGIQAALDELNDRFSGCIRNTKVTPQPPNPQFTAFQITF